jgi:hypothetical protein
MELPVRAASPGFQAHGLWTLGWISTLLRSSLLIVPQPPARHGMETAQTRNWAKSKMRQRASAAGLIPPGTFVATDSPSVPFSCEAAEAILFLEQFWGRATQHYAP